MTSFVDIPEEVIYGNLLPILKLPDMLRFRRVCKSTQALVDDFLHLEKFKQHPDDATGVEVEVNQRGKSLASLLKLGFKIPATRFYLNITRRSFFDDPVIPAFLEKYGEQITHLRVRNFFLLTSEAETKFYESLPNLTSLELEEMDVTYTDQFKRLVDRDSDRYQFPSTFRNLKRLKLGALRIQEEGDFGYAASMISQCDQLEYVNIPLCLLMDLNERESTGSFLFNFHGVDQEKFVILCAAIIMRRARKNPIEGNLKFCDLQNHQVEKERWQDQAINFVRLLEVCSQYGVQILNANALAFLHPNPTVEIAETFARICEPLVSLRNLHTLNYMMEAPNLEKLVIERTLVCSFRIQPGAYPSWPKLKTLDITVDSDSNDFIETAENFDNSGFQLVGSEVPTSTLMKFLFPENGVRTNLVDLRLQFNESIARSHSFRIKAKEIITTCPNLKHLKITNWQGTNKTLSMLWKGLSHLEEVYLGNCKELGNSAFVGKNLNDPTFLMLKGLKKLTFEGLDKMPKVTDTVFRLVFRHLKLSHLYLKSSEPIKNITINGIRCLQTGIFQESIERFKFQEWSLHGVPEEEFKKLESEFRSSQMI